MAEDVALQDDIRKATGGPPTVKHRRIRSIALQRFGRLYVKERVVNIENYRVKPKKCSWWRCQCICGNIAIVSKDALVSGNTRSCGCLRSDSARTRDVSFPNAVKRKPRDVECRYQGASA